MHTLAHTTARTYKHIRRINSAKHGMSPHGEARWPDSKSGTIANTKNYNRTGARIQSLWRRSSRMHNVWRHRLVSSGAEPERPSSSYADVTIDRRLRSDKARLSGCCAALRGAFSLCLDATTIRLHDCPFHDYSLTASASKSSSSSQHTRWNSCNHLLPCARLYGGQILTQTYTETLFSPY